MIGYGDILEGLRHIGVQPGMELEVHSSLKSFGPVDGGAEAVIAALKDSVGPDGSLFMPALRLSPDLPKTEEDLMLGVDIYRLTAMHYVEDLLPQRVRDIFKPSDAVAAVYPPDAWFVETGTAPVKAWYTIQDMAFQAGLIRTGRIGDSEVMFFPVGEVVGLYAQALKRDALELYGLK